MFFYGVFESPSVLGSSCSVTGESPDANGVKVVVGGKNANTTCENDA